LSLTINSEFSEYRPAREWEDAEKEREKEREREYKKRRYYCDTTTAAAQFLPHIP
jgi:hypothetical protein